MLEEHDPLTVEILASQLAYLWSRPDPLAQSREANAYLEGELVRLFAHRHDPGSAALLAGLAAVLPPDRAASARAAGSVGVHPRWASQMGASDVRDARTVLDECGDATQVLVRFGYPGRPDHALAVLVDHNLGGVVKDTWLAEDADELFAAVRDSLAKQPHLREAPADPAHIRVLLPRRRRLARPGRRRCAARRDGDLRDHRSYGLVVAASASEGRKPRRRFADLLIAATAHANRLDLYTRNADDFAGLEELVHIIAI